MTLPVLQTRVERQRGDLTSPSPPAGQGWRPNVTLVGWSDVLSGF